MHSFLIGKPECAKVAAMHKLAIYDLDKTITRRATFPPFIWHVLRHYRPLRIWALPFMALTTLGYGLKLVSRERLKEMNLALLLGKSVQAEDANRIATSFARATIESNTLSAAIARMEDDRRNGFRIVIASASYAFYVRAIADLLDIGTVIATNCVAKRGDAFSSSIDGANCYGQAKLDRVMGWLDDQNIDSKSTHIRFYSDHVSDAPCLEFADEAFATNPHPPLTQLATLRGWPILDWLSES